MLTEKTRKFIHKLHQKKYRHESGAFLVEGIKGVQEALKNASGLMLVVDEEKQTEPQIAAIVADAKKQGYDIEIASEKDIVAIKSTDTFPGIMAVVPMSDYDIEAITGPIIFLDHVNDPGNLGTIIRTADWFGVKNILLSEGSVDPYNEKVVRSSMGSIFRVNIFQSEKASEDIAWLKQYKKYQVVGLTLNGEKFKSLNHEPRTANNILAFGSESHGLAADIDKLLDRRYTISGNGSAESLNLGVAVGITLHQLNAKHI
ncbi:MAG: hypothetical protein COU35_00975 [Candidatus Magasanikbacteria bacterium CG10_big_fil_rev_8_21_14_0_10_47_10]|uniref:RNA 2-O ribose methyltransferase substrate binding domain-containing protein n=1 Tax=Candidatus Magasanikbacteria bacterium CG10_big_fil_rev_8_21_14_0_10_47_10 TaxID=1974652 RepID=A0A2H0TTI6_9BACT|nr:MAG: hypothetical protein COU35_00975 [Candidatus Magasanikbacteria bacterium CG10_big_fil_rev_8_21_14_0_10_47_10]